MPSITTVFRAIVMLAAAVILVKGWQLYGPSTEQMKSFTARAVEAAQEAWNQPPQASAANGSLTADPHVAAPPFTAPLSPPTQSKAPIAMQPGAGALAPGNNLESPHVFESPVVQGPLPAPDRMPTSDAEGDRLPALLARLEQLGGVEPQLVEWGSSGELYRFCCRAALADTPSFSRHFESVAEEPLVAVEEVLAKVEAWRTAQRGEGSIR